MHDASEVTFPLGLGGLLDHGRELVLVDAGGVQGGEVAVCDLALHAVLDGLVEEVVEGLEQRHAGLEDVDVDGQAVLGGELEQAVDALVAVVPVEVAAQEVDGPGGAVLLQRRRGHGAGVALLGVVGVGHDVLEVQPAGVLLLEPLDHFDRERAPGVVRFDEAGAVGDCHVARAADAGADDLTQAVLVVALLEQPHEVGLRAPADGVAVVDLVARVVLGLKLANLVAVLGVLHLEGLVEVGVGIAEAGRHKAPVGVDHLGGVLGRDLADRRDDAGPANARPPRFVPGPSPPLRCPPPRPSQ